MKLNIIEVPNKLLKQKSQKVETMTSDIKKFIDDMFETMYADKGVGLAAIQVGRPLKIITIDASESNEKQNNKLVLINLFYKIRRH